MRVTIGQSVWCEKCRITAYHKVVGNIEYRFHKPDYILECSECSNVFDNITVKISILESKSFTATIESRIKRR